MQEARGYEGQREKQTRMKRTGRRCLPREGGVARGATSPASPWTGQQRGREASGAGRRGRGRRGSLTRAAAAATAAAAAAATAAARVFMPNLVMSGMPTIPRPSSPSRPLARRNYAAGSPARSLATPPKLRNARAREDGTAREALRAQGSIPRRGTR